MSADELLDRVAHRDADAFRDLYRMFSPAAYGLALRVLREPQLAQDALQEAFEQIWTQASLFDPGRASAKSWIMTIVHRRAVSRVRREVSYRVRNDEWGRAHVDRDHDVVADVVELRAEHREVRSAMASLTSLQSEALTLAYFRGLTQAEVAAELGIPLGTAKTRLRDALQRLRLELEITR